MSNTITFATAAQAAIYEEELKGQFSDGLWENSPGDWPLWSNLIVKVDPDNVGVSFTPRRCYNVLNLRMLEYLDYRMIAIAKQAIIGYKKIQSYSVDKTRQKKLDKIEYTEKDLRKDLRAINKAMRTKQGELQREPESILPKRKKKVRKKKAKRKGAKSFGGYLADTGRQVLIDERDKLQKRIDIINTQLTAM